MKSNLRFTVAILSASLLAFILPDAIVNVAGFETKKLIIPLLMVIMFGMGTHLAFRDFIEVSKQPKAVILGIGLQFIVMPVTGALLALFSQLPAEIAAGIILVGCSPSGLASNVMCFIAKANLALSVTLTTFATLIAPLVTPFLMQLLAGEYVEVNPISMLLTMLKLVIFPVVGGMLFHHIVPARFARVFDVMPLVSMLGIILIVAIIIANGQQALVNMGWLLLGVVLVHNTLGFLLGYTGAKLAKLDEASCRTLAFEVGMQNSGLASGLALHMNKVATMGLAAALFSSVQNITGSLMAAFWSQTDKQPTT
ncbi:bile acid:sodium symporter family protein [Alteromonas sediminis]|uniref:Bile acid:sodium symporter family protein n=1 Tax=Alteromonas sediminis TaxID=2259342 RepID=A0A3N5Y410_9ALTE|nr:bile acid:sodium symporter family protein [Alteromonas sediminis]RPJ68762.1 bile acid:sodium symporter family protein [Alteromonas sediminis]